MFGLNLFAQTDTIQYGKLEVKVIDVRTKKPIEYALITIENDSFKKSRYTDSNGLFIMENIPIGTFNIYSSLVSYNKMKLQNVCIDKDSITYLKFEMIYSKIKMGCYFGPSNPLIKKDGPTQQSFDNKQIMRMPY